jgi:hypothetical protein
MRFEKTGERDMKRATTLVMWLAVFAVCASAAAERTVSVSVPGASSAYVYDVQVPTFTADDALERAALFAQSFAVPQDAIEAREEELNDVFQAVRYSDEDAAWVYSRFSASGFESFVDAARWLEADPYSEVPLIGEEAAAQIALDFAESHFTDSPYSEVYDVKVTRVMNHKQLNSDDVDREDRIIYDYSNEAVVKIYRAIDGIPVLGRGKIKIHVNNDGTVVGAFRRYRDLDVMPVDTVVLPTYDEVEAIAWDKAYEYCAAEDDCRVRAEVGYYESDDLTAQHFLEPVISIHISRFTPGGESMGDAFTIPVRDPAVAENPRPEQKG